jgi:hypothetical protein
MGELKEVTYIMLNIKQEVLLMKSENMLESGVGKTTI